MSDFISRIHAVIEENIANEQFGVTELADRMNMSRSNLLRKVKKDSSLSVTQLISQIRLTRGMELLRTSSLNVSEVSLQVGFSSASYFIKCFREYYGYPPGEVGKREAEGVPQATPTLPPPVVNGSRNGKIVTFSALGLLVVLAGALLMYYKQPSSESPKLEKSIAVLPFKNESNDSTNVYLINGLMESTLNNLQSMKELKVVSRTSSERYRSTMKSIPEIAKELNVNYFVEGSGQKIGDGILLNIQLIEATTDKHLWAKQYRREVKDIFALQQEIAKNIAEEIQVIITPEEEKAIEKIPTKNVVAYDFFLKGKDLFYRSGRKDLVESIPYFKNAIELDNEFALAYSTLVMVYYYLDVFSVEKIHVADIDTYADKAMKFDPKSGESLVAKGLAHTQKKEFDLAAPYFENALEYNPGNGLVIHFLTEFYHMHVPNTSKYLEYALQGARLDNPSLDSANASFKYYHLANALMQAGFMEEAMLYCNKSLAFNPRNIFANGTKGFLEFAGKKDLNFAREGLKQALKNDSTSFGLIQQMAKLSYLLRDYNSAHVYYGKFLKMKKAMRLDIYNEKNLEIGLVYSKAGFAKEAEELVQSFKLYTDNDKTIYKELHLSLYYCYRGDTKNAIEHLKLFSKEDSYIYQVLWLEMDPLVDPIRSNPEFKQIMTDIEKKFWKTNKRLRGMFEEKGLP